MHCPCHAHLQGEVYLASLFCRNASSSSSPFNAHLRSWRSQCLFFFILWPLSSIPFYAMSTNHPPHANVPSNMPSNVPSLNSTTQLFFFSSVLVPPELGLCALASLGQILLVVIFFFLFALFCWLVTHIPLSQFFLWKKMLILSFCMQVCQCVIMSVCQGVSRHPVGWR